MEVIGCMEQLDTCDSGSERLRMSVPWSESKTMTKVHAPMPHPLRVEAKTSSINLVIYLATTKSGSGNTTRPWNGK